VWFFPKEILPVSELHFEYSLDNLWLNLIKNIYEEGMIRWKGQVIMGMPDLGGTLDILAIFRSTESLLMDMIDEPEEVKRLIWEIHELWHRYYREFNDILQPLNPGYTDWSLIYSDAPSYILQSDTCYMMGPEMFEEFVKPELEASCRRLRRSVYHLDGIGQLNHVDSLLAIKELNGVQWVPGQGKPSSEHWPELHKKIHGSGKNIQLLGNLDCLDKVAEQIGTGKTIEVRNITGHIRDEKQYRERMKKYGIE
jgi:5-methyltetrahydrofolate--homocysteine methyltransferase